MKPSAWHTWGPVPQDHSQGDGDGGGCHPLALPEGLWQEDFLRLPPFQHSSPLPGISP